MSSCCGRRRKVYDEERDPLLPRYESDTDLQSRLRRKLHSYEMVRALSKGYMPSTEQTIILLRSIRASLLLNPGTGYRLRDSSRQLVKLLRQTLDETISLLRNKNEDDQLQELLWSITKSKLHVDTEDIRKSAAQTRIKADSSAAYESVKTIGSLLMTNKDFRIFLSDLTLIGRQVFADSASTLADAAQHAGKEIEPPKTDTENLRKPGQENDQDPSSGEIVQEGAEVSSVVADGIARTGETAATSLKDHVTGDEKQTLLYRLRQAVLRLRNRPDYSQSAGFIGNLIQRYALVYSQAAERAIETAEEDVYTNPELDKAVQNLVSLLSSFCSQASWDELRRRFEKVMSHSKTDPEFETFVTEIGRFVEQIFTDPDFFESAGEKIREKSKQSKDLASGSTLREDGHAFLVQLREVALEVKQDQDISQIEATVFKLASLLSPTREETHSELLQDSVDAFIPLLIQGIQYVPIPRLEVSVPSMDLLLENLILEPGNTVNESSFFPHAFRLQTNNDIVVRKGKFKTASTTSTLVTVTISGLDLRADDVGYIAKLHSGIFGFQDEGIASFHLDQRGIDISLDIEIGKDRLEKILTLRQSRVHIHHLSYNVRKSNFTLLSKLFKPLLRPLLRKTLEQKLASSIEDGFHFANRELLYARERLRATRISDPQDLRTFVAAIIARLTPAPDPDVFVDAGVRPRGEGVFAGIYAPGSVVKLWEEEAERAGEIVDDSATVTWRNEIFS